jgi:hypothetical protein
VPFNLLLLPLLGGFVFISNWNKTKFYSKRADKERLLLQASLAGLASLVLAYLVSSVQPFIPCVNWLPCLPTWWDSHIPFPYSGTSFLAFVFGATLWWPLNLIWDAEKESARIVREEGGPFEQLINDAMEHTRPIMLTMNGGKVYVGFVASAFTPGRENKTIEIVPIKSGYRERDQQRVVFTTDYSDVYNSIVEDYDSLVQQHSECCEIIERSKKSFEVDESRLANVEGAEENSDEVEALKRGLIFHRNLQSDSEQRAETQQEELTELETALNDFGLVIPISEIATITLYSAMIHEKYFPHKDPDDLAIVP